MRSEPIVLHIEPQWKALLWRMCSWWPERRALHREWPELYRVSILDVDDGAGR